MNDSLNQGTARVAAIQMVSGASVPENLAMAEQLLTQAASAGAQLAVLPENFALMSTSGLAAAGREEAGPAGPIRSFTAALARRLHLWILAGSLPISAHQDNSASTGERVRAASILFDPRGEEVARYDKIHLFDVNVADSHGSYRESAVIEPGDELVTADTPWARIGLSICYDLRFPELYRALLAQGAQLLAVPAAFTARTGEAHWEILLRARAIENLCYVIGAGQGGQHSPTRRTFGHSMIVDPWGKILASCGEGPDLVLADIDLGLQQQLRADMPVERHRRLYGDSLLNC